MFFFFLFSVFIMFLFGLLYMYISWIPFLFEYDNKPNQKCLSKDMKYRCRNETSVQQEIIIHEGRLKLMEREKGN